jgi:lipopolysaccharide transport system permease protein
MLTLWMFLTPIVYPASMVPARFQWVLDVNPMTAIVGAYRAALLDDRMPAPAPFALFAVIAIALFEAGHWLFMRTKPTFADLL